MELKSIGIEIDPETCPIEELEKVLEQVKIEMEFWDTMQLSAKRFINSVYGVFGTKFFNLSNADIAESITLQGQDLIRFSVRMINDYFKNMWPSDVNGHKEVSRIMKEKYGVLDFDAAGFEAKAREPIDFDTLQIYGDTDSAYITMEPLISRYGIPLEQRTKFCLAVHAAVLEDYLDKCFEEYAKSFNCEKNLEKFELEKISRSIIMLAKKNYMCDVAWTDTGTFYQPQHHITYTGYNVVRGETTDFCRKEMKKFTEFCFKKISEGRKPTQGEIVSMLRDCKKRFMMQSPNDIGKTQGISDYEKFVADDKDPSGVRYYETSKATDANVDTLFSGNNAVKDGNKKQNAKEKEKKLAVPIHIRSAAVYNNMLLTKQKKYLSKYELLKSGDKVRFYYTGENDVFGFVPDNFPVEFAPPVDIDVQFEKSILAPINRIVTAMGYDEIPPGLTYNVGLF